MEKAMAPHSSPLAWKIPWMEEPGRLQSMGSRRVGHDWVTSLFTFMHWRRKWQPTPVFLPGESQGRRSLVGYHLWGRTESDTTEVTSQQEQQWILKAWFLSACWEGLFSYQGKRDKLIPRKLPAKENPVWLQARLPEGCKAITLACPGSPVSLWEHHMSGPSPRTHLPQAWCAQVEGLGHPLLGTTCMRAPNFCLLAISPWVSGLSLHFSFPKLIGIHLVRCPHSLALWGGL